ncbi:MAG: F0F1 ATP synthase subunit B [Bacteroidales bacterium]|nr:F0F1 ATP synthase subunit B [Bacteroidales bacterium]MCF8387456.1 F0F1 ATP synthase subunit B [Bacteroidales bacterium]MCF8397456.1 F0F1 ATP synthase subunit B [Bacteroidales bacterium]
MELVQPGIGLIFWMTLSFGVVIWILGKFAWKPIMKSLKEREDSIDEALHTADKAREEMNQLKVDNEALIAKAKEDRDAILREARKVKEKIIDKARLKANEEANRIVENAKNRIENEKMAAMTDLKNQIASLSIEIAEKILQHELSDDKKQKEFVQKLIDDVNLN